MVQNGVVRLQYIATDEQVADVFTKPLSRVKFEYFKDKLGVIQKDFTSSEKRLFSLLEGSDVFPSSGK
jgi:hypothetical protein